MPHERLLKTFECTGYSREDDHLCEWCRRALDMLDTTCWYLWVRQALIQVGLA